MSEKSVKLKDKEAKNCDKINCERWQNKWTRRTEPNLEWERMWADYSLGALYKV